MGGELFLQAGGGTSNLSLGIACWENTYSALERRRPQTWVQPWSICTEGQAFHDWTYSSESHCPSPLGSLSWCTLGEKEGLGRGTDNVSDLKRVIRSYTSSPI